ncbi:hydrogenase maturation nickel metallochaperone HypA [Azospirillum thermophilum]|nr:hydrogenase maturation nickel metallochaperone HypA [Azospirillum thermophilum]
MIYINAVRRAGACRLERPMHELSLCESITGLVADCAAREGIGRVTRVTVAIGKASAIDPEALLFCFPITTEGTVAAGAELVVEQIALRARCTDCGAEFAPLSRMAPCPACGGFAKTLLAGQEMQVVSFEGE